MFLTRLLEKQLAIVNFRLTMWVRKWKTILELYPRVASPIDRKNFYLVPENEIFSLLTSLQNIKKEVEKITDELEHR